MITLSEKLSALDNLSHFSVKSGIPRRTLARIKSNAKHIASPSTRVAIESALKAYKPKKGKK